MHECLWNVWEHHHAKNEKSSIIDLPTDEATNGTAESGRLYGSLTIEDTNLYPVPMVVDVDLSYQGSYK